MKTLTIKRVINGEEYMIELSAEEIGKAFRIGEMEYMKEDAARQLFNFFGLDIDSYEEEELAEAEAIVKKRNGKFSIKALSTDDEMLEYLAEQFSCERDCNRTENDVWHDVIRDCLRDTFGYLFCWETEQNAYRKNVVNATFVSVWDGGTIISSSCKVDLDTKKIFDIQVVDCNQVCCHDEEYIVIDGERYSAGEEGVANDVDFWY